MNILFLVLTWGTSSPESPTVIDSKRKLIKFKSYCDICILFHCTVLMCHDFNFCEINGSGGMKFRIKIMGNIMMLLSRYGIEHFEYFHIKTKSLKKKSAADVLWLHRSRCVAKLKDHLFKGRSFGFFYFFHVFFILFYDSGRNFVGRSSQNWKIISSREGVLRGGQTKAVHCIVILQHVAWI